MVVTERPILPIVFLLFFLALTFFAFITGNSEDIITAFIVLFHILIFGLIFIRGKTTTFDKVEQSVQVKGWALIRPAPVIALPLKSVKSIKITRAKGTSAQGPTLPRVVLKCENQNVAITSLGSTQFHSSKARSVIQSIQAFIFDTVI
ncbi:hypothetical protein [Acaryochloris sp. IP29b_bin.148]|uniref:hypothetical protein n=1 Tax=Acaryochloris sp. IP29b_bin.148 TaxID=2969218 RepID=UPI00261E9E85|nr:hypothetical protein [Acaryochloris sp. IP29b_bin.148]